MVPVVPSFIILLNSLTHKKQEMSGFGSKSEKYCHNIPFSTKFYYEQSQTLQASPLGAKLINWFIDFIELLDNNNFVFVS